MRRRFVLGLGLFIASWSIAPGAAPSLQDQYLDIYIKMNESAKLEAGGDLRNALAGFEDCYNRLDKIHGNDPGWENALVTSRMGDCRARILALETRLAPPPGKPAPATAASTAPAPAPESPQARLAALVAAAKAAPNDAPAQFNLGTAYFQLDQTDAAIEALQRGLVLEPSNIYGHNYLGCALLRKDRIQSAAREFQKAIALVETFAEAHYNLAILYATEDPPALNSARTQYKRALELGMVPDPHLQKILRASAH